MTAELASSTLPAGIQRPSHRDNGNLSVGSQESRSLSNDRSQPLTKLIQAEIKPSANLRSQSPILSDIGSDLNMKEVDDHMLTIFKTQLDLQTRIERAKVTLSLKTDFNLIDAFRIFDRNGLGVATSFDFKAGLAELGLQV